MPNTKHPKRSGAFDETRQAHLKEAAEDYTELIAELIEEKGEARTCELAEILGVSHVTASRTINRLQKCGYLDTSPRKPVTLTQLGQETANYCKQRHQILLKFFIAIGIPRQVAEVDVEGVEHHISQESLEVIKQYMSKNIKS